MDADHLVPMDLSMEPFGAAHISLRTISDLSNPFKKYSNKEFRQRFRFQKDSVIALLYLLSSDLVSSSKKKRLCSPNAATSHCTEVLCYGKLSKT